LSSLFTSMRRLGSWLPLRPPLFRAYVLMFGVRHMVYGFAAPYVAVRSVVFVLLYLGASFDVVHYTPRMVWP